MNKNFSDTRGFTLVELSVVLVIIGLLVGGILVGTTMIRQSEIKAVMKEFNQYTTAAHAFRTKYNALPGDMDNAEDYWGSATCPTAAGTGTQTCDGNGDGRFNEAAAASQFGEYFTFWQHLNNAGIIGGNYTGMAGSGAAAQTDIDVNVPASKLGSAAWSVGANFNATGGSAVLYAGLILKNFAVIGSEVTNARSYGKILTPQEAWSIDTKFDDGRPAHGTVIGAWWDDCTDATANTDLDSDYLLSVTDKECSLYFANAF